MPKLPIYTAQETGNVRANGQQFGVNAAVAKANMWGNVGNDVGRLAEDVYRYKEERDVAKAQDQAAQARIDWTKRLQDMKMNAPEGAEGFTDSFEKSFSDWQQQQGQDLQTEKGQKVLHENLNALRSQGTAEALDFEATSFGNMQKRNLQEKQDAFQNVLRDDPAQLPAVLMQMKQLTDSTPGVDEQTKGAVWKTQHMALYDSTVDGMVSKLEANGNVTNGQIAAVRNELTKNKEWGSNTDPKMFDSALTRLDKLQKDLKEKNDGLARFYMQNEIARLGATGENPNGITEAAAMATADTPLAKAQIAQQFRTAELVGGEVKRAKDTSFQDDLKRINDMRTGLGTTSDFVPKNEQYEAAVQAYQQKAKIYDADPASYVINNNPVVMSQYQQWKNEKDPEKSARLFQNYAVFQAAKQQAMAPGQPVKLVTKEWADQVTNQVAEIGQNANAAVNTAKLLATIQNQGGPKGAQILGELHAAKAINDAQIVAGNVALKNNPLAVTILRAGEKNAADWAKLSGGYTTDMANKDAASALDKLRPSLAAQGNLALLDTYQSTLAQTLLYQHAAGENPDAGDLADSMILGEYAYHGAMRIPTAVNADTVRKATSNIQDNIGSLDIVPPLGRNLKSEDYLRSVKSFGQWTTSEHEDGAVLLDDVGRPVMEKVQQGGQTFVVPVKRTWQQLQLMPVQ